VCTPRKGSNAIFTSSTGKMMVHLGDWIYFHADVDDYNDNTIFRYGDSSNLLPKDSSNPIYALFDDGDMNVKNSGFEVYIHFK
jgi:hypothetical protein